MDISAKLNRLMLCGFTATIIQGCAISSVFNPYPNQAEDFRAAIGAQQNAQALGVIPQTSILDELNEERESADAMLYMMERGRLAQLESLFDQSKQDFQLVIDAFEQQDLAATVSAGDTAAQGASLLTNDNAIPYSGAGYERIFTHHHQALNYWGAGDVEGASIEFRKLALEQQVLLEKFEEEIGEAQAEAEEQGIQMDTLSSEFAGLDAVAGQVKSSFQNAYTFYTSAAFWEAIGEFNNALVDYKKAFEINPDVEMIKQDVARVSHKLGMQPELKDYNLPEKNQGSVVILFEDGFVPAKSETKLVLPLLDGSLVSIAFPTYDTQVWPQSNILNVRDDQFNDFGPTHPVVDVGALAVKHLKEQIPSLVVRQVLRAVAKDQLQKQTGDINPLAGLAANLYNVLSESADRRSWLTLPNTAQVLRINLEEGARELSLTAGVAQRTLKLDIQPERTVFVRVVHANNQLIPQVFTL